MTYKRRRTSRKGKCSKKNSVRFVVSLTRRKHTGTTTYSQVQKRLDSSLKNVVNFTKVNGKVGICAVLAAAVPLWLSLAVKGVKKDTSLNGKRICIDITRGI